MKSIQDAFNPTSIRIMKFTSRRVLRLSVFTDVMAIKSQLCLCCVLSFEIQNGKDASASLNNRQSNHPLETNLIPNDNNDNTLNNMNYARRVQ